MGWDFDQMRCHAMPSIRNYAAGPVVVSKQVNACHRARNVRLLLDWLFWLWINTLWSSDTIVPRDLC